MRRITLILITVLSMVNSENVSENEINQLQSILRESADYMSEHAKNEDVYICIGGTRAGKSTLVNYLIGTELKVISVGIYQPNVIVKKEEKSLGPDIGLGILSKSTIPTRWVSKIDKNLIIWDAAGFGDNRGPIQDITNAFYIYQLIRQVKSLKIILVINVNDILHDNTKQFLEVLEALENLFGEGLKKYFSSIAVIFSRGEKTFDGSPLDTEFIREKLKVQFLLDNGLTMSKITKGFIKYLTKHPKQIGLFRRAEAIGKLSSDIDVNISQAINSCKSIQNKDLLQIHPSFSENSKQYLNQLHDKLYSTSVFEILEKDLNKKLQNIFYLPDNSLTKDKLGLILQSLRFVNRIFILIAKSNNNNIYDTMEPILETDFGIKMSNLSMYFKGVELVNELLKNTDDEFKPRNSKNVLYSFQNTINELMLSTDIKIKQMEKNKTIKETVKNSACSIFVSYTWILKISSLIQLIYLFYISH